VVRGINKKKRREDLRKPGRSLEDIQKGTRDLALYNHCDILSHKVRAQQNLRFLFFSLASFLEGVVFLRRELSEAGSERPFIIDIRESILDEKGQFFVLK